MGSPPFLIGQSEWTNILVFIATSYGLSIEIFKFKIENFAAADMVGILADPLLRAVLISFYCYLS